MHRDPHCTNAPIPRWRSFYCKKLEETHPSPNPYPYPYPYP